MVKGGRSGDDHSSEGMGLRKVTAPASIGRVVSQRTVSQTQHIHEALTFCVNICTTPCGLPKVQGAGLEPATSELIRHCALPAELTLQELYFSRSQHICQIPCTCHIEKNYTIWYTMGIEQYVRSVFDLLV